jgi:hypothetical protein
VSLALLAPSATLGPDPFVLGAGTLVLAMAAGLFALLAHRRRDQRRLRARIRARLEALGAAFPAPPSGPDRGGDTTGIAVARAGDA